MVCSALGEGEDTRARPAGEETEGLKMVRSCPLYWGAMPEVRRLRTGRSPRDWRDLAVDAPRDRRAPGEAAT